MNWNEKEQWFSGSLEHLGALKSKDSFSGVGASQEGPDGVQGHQSGDRPACFHCFPTASLHAPSLHKSGLKETPAAPSLPFSILMNSRKYTLIPEQIHKHLKLT